MGNAQPESKKNESDQFSSNMKVINSAQMIQNQNMDYSNLAAFDINSKMRSTLKYLEKNNFVSLKFVFKAKLILGRFKCFLYSNDLEKIYRL